MPDRHEIREEQIRMVRLRVLVDLTAYRLRHAELSRTQGLSLIERMRDEVMVLFPEKGHVFELVLRPRFERILNERAIAEWDLTDALN
jgi:hypothetical protein